VLSEAEALDALGLQSVVGEARTLAAATGALAGTQVTYPGQWVTAVLEPSAAINEDLVEVVAATGG